MNLENDTTRFRNYPEVQCKYYTLQNSPGIDNTFSVIHMNARSIKNKFDEIKKIVLNSNSEWDVVCISETWLKDDVIEQHNILHPLQFGFRKMRSTYMPLAHMYDEISKYCHKGEAICTIYLDLKKQHLIRFQLTYF